LLDYKWTKFLYNLDLEKEVISSKIFSILESLFSNPIYIGLAISCLLLFLGLVLLRSSNKRY
jgi:hypothetical protein